MGPLDLFFHILGFCAPALAVAFLIAGGARVFMRTGPFAGSWWVHAAINSIVGVLVLGAGLWYFGVDGKMATYAGLAVAVASTQWVLCRAWRGQPG
jgi:hypothetical protein